MSKYDELKAVADELEVLVPALLREKADLIAENERLAATLRDFFAMGEQYEWGRSTTGRQVLMRQARDLLKEVANV